ncbi:MAG: hypothetical protein JXA82_15765, partial [Sedimentisphaerales bacterium]|nr:hypothetical protein [Sedimentisphaerales bacterium]
AKKVDAVTASEPQTIMNQVPPEHLHVELCILVVNACKSSLHWRLASGRLCGHVILRQHNLLFPFEPSRIFS